MDDVMLSYQFNCESSVGGGREISQEGQEEGLLEHASEWSILHGVCFVILVYNTYT